ncbi:alpha/beta hydrolase [Nocardia donostiensis]|uniref:Alpha/beta hydrolase n=1 Tax=Nocardia donostiensis TaxID=1538463 RepID=A0A1W0B758_9NOCA|nr:alpha/beta hydrolase [Nocardia donostiensis]OQS13271.1 alpha/beta hydrolase [Nocardia donostiensis]OQS18362.1 alpha/beta hydrolase [Nocardia donostiensis]
MGHPARPVMHALTYQPTRRIEQTPSALGLDYTDLSIPTADGQTLHAWWLRSPRSVGHVLFGHGNAGNIGDRVPIYALLTEAGFDVLAFDYRGYGRSTGRPDEPGTALDARAARKVLLEQPGVAEERVLYLGKSLGGAVMTELAVVHPPAGLILMSTFTGLRAVARSLYPFLPAPLIPDAYPTLRRIGALRAPLLLMHGDNDELIPLSHADRIYAAAPEPKQLVIYPGAGHNDIIAQAMTEWTATITGWARDNGLC